VPSSKITMFFGISVLPLVVRFSSQIATSRHDSSLP
jgi:hypothetical protein